MDDIERRAKSAARDGVELPSEGLGLEGLTDPAEQPRRSTPLIASLAASGLVQGLNVATGVILARELGPAGRGELAAVLLWPGLLAVLAGLGIGQAATYYAAKKETAPATLVTTSLTMAAVQALIAMFVGALLFPLIYSGYESETLQSAYVYLVFIPLNLAALLLMGILNGLQFHAAFQALRVLVIAIAAFAIVALALAGELTVQRAVFAYLAANLLTLIAAAYAMRKAWEGPATIDRALGRSLFSFGVRSQTTTVSSLFNERLDQLAISLFLSPASLGIYTVAVTLTALTTLVGYSVSLVALPAVARAAKAEIAIEVRTYVAAAAGGSALVSIPVLLLAPELVQLFFGSAYDDAAAVSRILLVAAVAFSTSRTLEAVLQGLGQPLDAGLAEGGALIFTVIGLAILLPWLGITGAAVASLIAYAASVAFMTRRTRAHVGLSAGELLIPRPSTWEHLVADLRRPGSRGAP